MMMEMLEVVMVGEGEGLKRRFEVKWSIRGRNFDGVDLGFQKI